MKILGIIERNGMINCMKKGNSETPSVPRFSDCYHIK
jgi:hypothetical protein